MAMIVKILFIAKKDGCFVFICGIENIPAITTRRPIITVIIYEKLFLLRS